MAIATAAALGLVAPLAAGITYGVVSPGSCAFGRVISRGDPGTPRVALTFDDGPTPPFTERVLDILERFNVRGSFFVIGRNVERAGPLLQRMHDAGHVIGNHTFDHPHYGFCRTLAYWQDQLRRTNDVIESAIGRRPALFRAPLGFKSPLTLAAARREGLTAVAWTRRAFDGIRCSKAQILRRLAGPTCGGDILTLHDGLDPHAAQRDPEPTLAALPELIERLIERGLELVTLERLLGIPAYQGHSPSAVAVSA
jgi:peptidoglycan/xylan/chitin deacetylase (PgdA/CDA1 family)